jgi:ribosomal protein L37AE/L43A
MTALATTAAQSSALARQADSELSVEDIVAQVRKVQEVMSAVMKENEHYGVIPGTKAKPTLLKPGAEKLCLLFRLDPEYELLERTREGDHLTITARCVLYHAPTGQRRGSGLGSCSSRESKYAYRRGERKCPKCEKETIRKSKNDEGWYCWRKLDGCGATFKPGDKAIEGQEVGRVANPDLADTYNTVLKMATKRALVAAVLIVTAASDIFTQDLEDLPPPPEEQAPPRTGGKITPHADADEDPYAPPPQGGPFESLMDQLVDLESHTDRCADYNELLALRAVAGSKADPSVPLLKALQAAREQRSISPDQRKALSQIWARVDRKLDKLKSQLKPDVADSFRDDPEDFER